MGEGTARKVFLVNHGAVPAGMREEGERTTLGFLALEPEEVWARLRESPADGARGQTNQDPHADEPTPAGRERRVEPYEARGLLERAKASLAWTRYRAKVGAHIWSVDEFDGPHAGLWLATVELDEPGEAFVKPAWVAGDVTDDPRYALAALAKSGRAPD